MSSTTRLPGYSTGAGSKRGSAPRSMQGPAGFVAVLDVDHMKRLNDGYGHAAGDAFLRAASERLAELCGPNALLAHLSSDEFVIHLSAADEAEVRAKLAELVSGLAEVPAPMRLTTSAGRRPTRCLPLAGGAARRRRSRALPLEARRPRPHHGRGRRRGARDGMGEPGPGGDRIRRADRLRPADLRPPRRASSAPRSCSSGCSLRTDPRSPPSGSCRLPNGSG